MATDPNDRPVPASPAAAQIDAAGLAVARQLDAILAELRGLRRELDALREEARRRGGA